MDQDLSVEEIAGLYTAVDCLVYPYRGEGFALPVLEAMASGIPVIVTAGGATDDFVREAFGWFIPAKKIEVGSKIGNTELTKAGWMLQPDSFALAMQMKWVSQHPEISKIKGQAAAKYVAKFWTWKKSAEIAALRLEALSSQ
jgi:glycosyltransferase involved in cell wall biosynthesis